MAGKRVSSSRILRERFASSRATSSTTARGRYRRRFSTGHSLGVEISALRRASTELKRGAGSFAAESHSAFLAAYGCLQWGRLHHAQRDRLGTNSQRVNTIAITFNSPGAIGVGIPPDRPAAVTCTLSNVFPRIAIG